MSKYRVAIDVCCSMSLYVEAESFEEAERKANAELDDEDVFFETHQKDLVFWNPEIDEIVEEE